MSAAARLRTRWLQDFPRRERSHFGQDISGVLFGWLSDPEWVAAARRIPPAERRALLAQFGRETFDENRAGYAARLRANAAPLAPIWNEDEREEVLRDHTAALLVELSDRISFCDPDETEALLADVRFAGFEHIEAGLERGRGIIFLSVHQSHPSFGFKHPWIAPLRVLGVSHDSELGQSGTALLLQGVSDAIELLPAAPRAVRDILRALSANQCLAVYNDFVYPETAGIASPLFGRNVLISRSALAIALKTEATILPVAIARQLPWDDGGVEVQVFAPLRLDDLDRSDPSALRMGALRFGIATECLIRRYPAQWRLWDTLLPRWQSC